MANIEKLKIQALQITGANYIAWTTDVELHLDSQNLLETIKEKNESPANEKAKAIIFLRKHLDENLMHDYANVKDPVELWKALKNRFDNQKAITLPHALDEWANLRFLDFNKVAQYNSTMLRIVAQLEYCGKKVSEDEMLNKTYLTFHKEHYVLAEQYRNCKYKMFSELIVALMIAEKNNELLIKNHNARPAGTKAFPEVNAADVKNLEKKDVNYPEKGNQSYRGRGGRFNRGRGRNYNSRGRGSFKWVRPQNDSKGKEHQENSTQKSENVCYRCGSKGHWARTCRTPPHPCKLYMNSTKGKGKEVNLAENFEDTSYLDSPSFANDLD
ncbi:uncharacterized protein LOC110226376 [Arabidopsis lyrata subsp. lyrata]|uniref:uncharacterized protein LOC110226376 n=1 Tax=Arabidopsis lyrata subsp. lyrata TaxID=81972 RepID=UPI000A29D97E|nr:uncharacterized protein LOC110226376 [Arabidopsis lyrata subsp. lyrata]|eukprot:XP_020873582.1 uncharacterized protein LOC110226376 [Arabidopsis lyrata subsp. lyrata]